MTLDRRSFLQLGSAAALGAGAAGLTAAAAGNPAPTGSQTRPDYTLRIATGLIEISPEQIVSTTLYNGQFPGPLLRFREGQPVSVEIQNDSGSPTRATTFTRCTCIATASS